MEIKISSRTTLNILRVLAWIIFIGVCVEAGGFIVNAFIVLVTNSDGARNYWQGADLSPLLKYDRGHFMVQTLLMIIVAVMRVILFYLLIKLLYNKKVTLSQPFNNEVRRFILICGYLALGIAFFSGWGSNYAEWLGKKGIAMPDIQHLRLGGADVWLFMGVILFVIAHIFKRGIEIQTENELTV
jgi:hypothetical protein